MLDAGLNIGAGTKCCSRCGENLPLEAFGKNASRKDGLNSSCKACRNAADIAKRAAKWQATIAPYGGVDGAMSYWIAEAVAAVNAPRDAAFHEVNGVALRHLVDVATDVVLGRWVVERGDATKTSYFKVVDNVWWQLSEALVGAGYVNAGRTAPTDVDWPKWKPWKASRVGNIKKSISALAKTLCLAHDDLDYSAIVWIGADVNFHPVCTIHNKPCAVTPSRHKGEDKNRGCRSCKVESDAINNKKNGDLHAYRCATDAAYAADNAQRLTDSGNSIDLDKPAIWYLAAMADLETGTRALKPGITGNTTKIRYAALPDETKYTVLEEFAFDTGHEAKAYENRVLEVFEGHNFTDAHGLEWGRALMGNANGATELLSPEALDDLCEFVGADPDEAREFWESFQ